MKNKLIAIVFFVGFFLCGYSEVVMTKDFRSKGSIKPTPIYSVPSEEHGKIIYITSNQDKIIKTLSAFVFINIFMAFLFLYKAGISWRTNALDFKKM